MYKKSACVRYFLQNNSCIYPSRIGFRFSEPDFTRTLDFPQSQNPRLSNAKPLVLFNRKNQNFRQTPALKFLKPLRDGYNIPTIAKKN